MSLQIGQPAPTFQAQSDDGQHIRLEDLRGKWVFLFFYPRANTPGCSLEARRIEAIVPELHERGVAVIGVSTDTEANQAHFRERCGLTYPLLPDSDKVIARAYQVLNGLGALFGITGRQSFLIDPQGKLVHHWKFVNPQSHASEVLEKVKQVTGQ